MFFAVDKKRWIPRDLRDPDARHRAEYAGLASPRSANKYPVLRIEGKLGREGVGMFDKMSGVGAHEVIIETPEHDLELADLPEGHIASVMRTYRERMRDLSGDDRFKYVLIFKNQGYLAGASIAHPHSQLIATR